MNQRDWELLDQQMRRSSPPRNDVITSLTVVAVLFLAGLVLGGIIFAHKDEPTRIAQQETKVSTLFPHGAPRTTLR
jgi:hypothetical protein